MDWLAALARAVQGARRLPPLGPALLRPGGCGMVGVALLLACALLAVPGLRLRWQGRPPWSRGTRG